MPKPRRPVSPKSLGRSPRYSRSPRGGGSRTALDPKNDVVFRALFGRRENRKLLRSLINELLELRGSARIEKLVLLPRDHELKRLGDRESIVDVAVTDQGGRMYVVEMQLVHHAQFADRMLYYAARRFAQQLDRGQGYHLLRPLVLLAILDFALFDELPQATNRFELRPRRRDDIEVHSSGNGGVIFSNQLAIVTVELPKFQVGSRGKLSPSEQWMKFLIQGERMNIDPEGRAADGGDSDPYISEIIEAYDALHALRSDDAVREAYERRLDEARVASIRYRTAKAEGRQEGREEGIVEGMKRALLSMAKSQLRHRFGEPPAALMASLDSISEPSDLEGVVGAIASGADLPEIQRVIDECS